MKFKYIIFDLDGVLIDSEINMKKSWNYTSKLLSLGVDFNKYKKFIGLPFNEILLNLGIKKRHKKIQEIYSKQSIIFMDKIKPFLNVKKILKLLEKKNIHYSIVTSKDNSRTLKILKKFNIKPTSLHTPNNKLRGKPYPDHINYCIKKNQYIKKLTCYVGDTDVDFMASKNAGIKFIFASYGFGKDNKKYSKKLPQFLDILKFISWS